MYKRQLLGKSGAGKTTLISILNGTLKPNKGRVKFFNTEFEKLNLYQKSKISTIWQDLRLIEDLSAEQNVNCGLLGKQSFLFAFKNLLNISSFNKAHQYMQVCNLKKSIFSKNIRKISGGQKQRVAIARAMITQPKVLLADELTGALDSKTSKEVMALIQEINKSGKTILIVTHEEDIAKMCSRIVRLKDGVIMEDKRNKMVKAI